MNRISLHTRETCNEFLKTNSLFSNGKNFSLTRLHRNCAKSRLQHENIFGIYLTKPLFTWMALWIAITSRSKLKKRQVNYIRPDVANGDYIGGARIFNPENLSPEIAFCPEAYLYLFNPASILQLPRLDLSRVRLAKDKQDILEQNGFRMETIVCWSERVEAYIPTFSEKMLVDIDEWQVALVNIDEITPETELVIDANAINELSSIVGWLSKDPGENYIL